MARQAAHPQAPLWVPGNTFRGALSADLDRQAGVTAEQERAREPGDEEIKGQKLGVQADVLSEIRNTT